jgi:rhodanese-related sulfurtransferase
VNSQVWADELARGLERGQVALIDVRTAEAFASGHIPGSWPVALMSLPARLRDPDDELWKRLFGSSSGDRVRVCVVADAVEDASAAVSMLAEVALIDVQIVKGGIRAWSAAGRPLNRAFGPRR